MTSIKRRFNYIKHKNPYWSSWTCFAQTIYGKNFSKDSVRRYFSTLVDKTNYENSDKQKLLNYLYLLTKDICCGQPQLGVKMPQE